MCTVVVLTVSVSGAFAQAEGPPAHPITTEQVKRLLLMTHTLERIQTLMHTSIEQQKKITTVLPPAFWDDLELRIEKIDWVALATPVYQRHLSQEDAEKIIAFYSTDVGQRALTATMEISTELQQAGQELGKKMGAEVAQKHSAEIQERMRQQQKTPEIKIPDSSEPK